VVATQPDLFGLDARVPARWPDTSIAAVAREFGTTRAQILGESRRAEAALPRFVLIALAHRVLGYALARIGRLIGRDHTAVLHGLRAIEARAAADPDFAARLEALAAEIRTNQEDGHG
jgi:chromosomal replication initiator protein